MATRSLDTVLLEFGPKPERGERDTRLEQLEEKLMIPGTLETIEDYQWIYQQDARTGRHPYGKSMITAILHKELGVPFKTRKKLHQFTHDKIQINNRKSMSRLKRDIGERVISEEKYPLITRALRGEEVQTYSLFRELHGKERINYFANDIGRFLIDRACGPGMIRAANYTQGILNSTGKQRTGGRKLKDFYIFVHSLRTEFILYNKGATLYHRRLGMFHDVIEDMRFYRQEKLAEERKNLDNIVPYILNSGKVDPNGNLRVIIPPDEVKLIKGPAEKISLLKDQIETPPEYKEIYNLYKPILDKLNGEEKDKLENELFLMEYHLDLVTRREEESFKGYISRMVDGSLNLEARDIVKKIALNQEEEANYLASVFIAKCADSIDNTERVVESNVDAIEARLDKNLILIENGVNKFIERYNMAPKLLFELRDRLIEVSEEKILGYADYQKKQGSIDAVEVAETIRETVIPRYEKLKRYDFQVV